MNWSVIFSVHGEVTLSFDLICAGKFFPYADMHKWMSYGNGTILILLRAFGF